MSVTSVSTIKELCTRNLALKLLCLAVAASVWCLSSTSRRAQVEFSLPLRVTEIPAGYGLSLAPPSTISFTLSGPPIQINKVQHTTREVIVNMAGTVKPGKTVFMHLESHLKLPEGIEVIRVSPAELELNLESGKTPTGGQ